jgi:hypothetical protein
MSASNLRRRRTACHAPFSDFRRWANSIIQLKTKRGLNFHDMRDPVARSLSLLWRQTLNEK